MEPCRIREKSREWRRRELEGVFCGAGDRLKQYRKVHLWGSRGKEEVERCLMISCDVYGRRMSLKMRAEDNVIPGIHLPIGHGDEHWHDQLARIVLKVACLRVSDQRR